MGEQTEGHKTYCSQHQDNMIAAAEAKLRMASLEAADKVLFEKLDSNGKILREIEGNVKGLCVKFDAFKKYNEEKFAAFQEHYDERVELSNGVIAEYRQAMISINKKFLDVEEKVRKLMDFDWFRRKMDWCRDNVLWMVVILMLIGIVGIFLTHWASKELVEMIIKAMGK